MWIMSNVYVNVDVGVVWCCGWVGLSWKMLHSGASLQYLDRWRPEINIRHTCQPLGTLIAKSC